MHLRLEKRLKDRWWIKPLVTLVSLLLALIVGAVVMECASIPYFKAYTLMLEGAFGSVYGLSETVVKAIPLMMLSLGIGIAFRMLLWNIGAEGQYCMGAVFSCAVALTFPNLPMAVMIPLMICAGFLGGALWGAIPGALKAFLDTNEIITTLMLNYVAIYFLEFLVYGPWKDPSGYKFPMTAVLSPSSHFHQFGNTRIHLGIVIALVLMVVFHIILTKTRWGYEIKVAGENREAARYAGINITRNIILVMIISGGIAGLAGTCELAGIQHRLQHGFDLGYGYTAIIIAWLARLNPVSTIVVSFFFAGLIVSGDHLQMSLGVGSGVAEMIQGIILFFVLAGELFLNYRVTFRKDRK
ncbi:MAG: ABC transporter permease [Vulcanimicrobiota bacterium]